MKISKPESIVIETVAAQLAATFYEIGRGQGLTSKHKTVKEYVRANIQKFVPKAVEYCIDQLANPMVSSENKALIFKALQERVNDPENDFVNAGLPDIDIKTILPKQEPKPVIVNTERQPFNINKMHLKDLKYG